MDEQKNRIKTEIDQIEPSEAVKARMLANIKQKAALQSANAPSEEPKRTKIRSFNRVMKWALPVAAGFVIVLAGALLAPNLTMRKNFAPNASYDFAMEAERGDTAKEENAQSGISPMDSVSPSNPSEKSDDAEIVSYEFQINSNQFSLLKFGQGESFEYGRDQQGIPVNENATLTVIQEGNTVRLEITWSDGEYSYLLTNTDGATQEEMIAAYESVK